MTGSGKQDGFEPALRDDIQGVNTSGYRFEDNRAELMVDLANVTAF
jgi:hypothetical protein